MRYEEILKQLKSLSNSEAATGMAKFGINPENTYSFYISIKLF